jgi:uncharacterized damage-inducible protein DinB
MKPWITGGLLLAAAMAVSAQTRALPTPSQGIDSNFRAINRKVLEMAQDFPADKYNFAPTKEMRSFGDVVLHIMAGNNFAAKVTRGENVTWEGEEIAPKTFKGGKDSIVAAFRKSVDDAAASLQKQTPEQLAKSLAPWLAVIEHAGEHYGQLVVYYRLNGMVPPESRPQSKQ